MTESNLADDAKGPEKGRDGAEGDDTRRAGSDLTREALEAELARARDDAAKYRQRAKEFGDDETYRRAKDAVAALDKAEQDKKSEVEKLTEAREGLLHRASSAEQALLRMRVSLAAGIGSDQLDEFSSRLRGDNEDELKKDAEQLARFFGGSSSTTSNQRRGDHSQGAGGDRTTPADPLQAALIDKLGIPH